MDTLPLVAMFLIGIAVGMIIAKWIYHDPE